MGDKMRVQAAAENQRKQNGYSALQSGFSKRMAMKSFLLKICEEAGVSNGSFYHHFKTKDDLLSYYIEDQPSIDPDFARSAQECRGNEVPVIHVYPNYVNY